MPSRWPTPLSTNCFALIQTINLIIFAFRSSCFEFERRFTKRIDCRPVNWMRPISSNNQQNPAKALSKRFNSRSNGHKDCSNVLFDEDHEVRGYWMPFIERVSHPAKRLHRKHFNEDSSKAQPLTDTLCSIQRSSHFASATSSMSWRSEWRSPGRMDWTNWRFIAREIAHT